MFFDAKKPENYGKTHICNYRICRLCKKHDNIECHECYMTKLSCRNINSNSIRAAMGQPIIQRAKGGTDRVQLFVYFDIEARQESASNWIHDFALACIHVTCQYCAVDEDDDAYLSCKHHCNLVCASKLTVHTVEDFFQFMMRLRNATVIAHNFRGYDSYFVMAMFAEHGVKYEPIMNGSKCMCINLRNSRVRFIDSYNFMPMPLSDFSTTFGLTALKGHFPHYLNTLENANYKSALADIAVEYYGYSFMSKKKQIEFMAWYTEEVLNDAQFDMARDMELYCDNDVEILRKGCNRFRKIAINLGQTDPFRECATIASMTMRIYRRLFMPENSIGILQRFFPCRMQSRKSMDWLAYVEYTTGESLRTAASAKGEKRYGRYSFDGYCKTTNTVYEFLGSYWHGDPAIFATYARNSVVNCTMGELYNNTISRINELIDAGFRVVTIWERQWDAMCKSNAEVMQFMTFRSCNNNALRIREIESCVPLSPSDAFFGGRTNAVRLYYKCEARGEQIKAIDVNSLYPYVCKYGAFPIGHPKVLKGFDLSTFCIDDYFGICKCIVLPPRNLFFPVLPMRHPTSNKLIFPLCHVCATNCGKNAALNCNHTEDERYWTGTWSTLEISFALKRGYILVHVYEIWNFEKSQYDPKTRSGGIFAEFMNTFLRVKQESSKLPKEYIGNISAYIDLLWQREGIKMEITKLRFNEGLRKICKNIVNSLWGKFAQRENMMKTLIVKCYAELQEIMNNPLYTVHDVVLIASGKINSEPNINNDADDTDDANFAEDVDLDDMSDVAPSTMISTARN